jgi:hypothetical protein
LNLPPEIGVPNLVAVVKPAQFVSDPEYLNFGSLVVGVAVNPGLIFTRPRYFGGFGGVWG